MLLLVTATLAARPNVMHVVADDLGYLDLGYKNNRTISPVIIPLYL